MAESKTLSLCKVVPHDSPSHFSLPLTFFDRIMVGIKPVACLYFYELFEPDTDYYHTIIPKLKHSLSLALKHYLPLAGNLTWPHDSNTPIVQYNNGDGVSLTITETHANFDYLSGDVFREYAELCSLLSYFPFSETIIPAMTLQVTIFPKRGFSIGCVAHHAVIDGKTLSLFIHSWAYICKRGEVSVLPPELTPSFDRSFVEQQAELEKVYPKGFGLIDPESRKLPTLDLTPPSMVLGTFRLTREKLESLRNETKTNATRVSTFTMTGAYVLICLIRTKKVTAEFTSIGFGADARLRLEPPLSSTYFGNCVAPCKGGRDTKDFSNEDGLVAAIDLVGEILSNLQEGVVKVVKRLRSPVPKSCVMFYIGGSPRSEHYKADFGWGKPRKVDLVMLDGCSEFDLLDDREEKGGIEIGITLEKHETEAFTTVFGNGFC